MPESLPTRLMRYWFNFFPAFRGTGARVKYIAADYREICVDIPLSWRTRNYVGTIYGGSMYGGIDPIYMIMLIKTLGPAYDVWDKAATIRFLKPGRSTLHACCRVETAETDAIKATLETQHSVDRQYTLDLIDDDGVVCAQVDKVVYVRKKQKPQAEVG